MGSLAERQLTALHHPKSDHQQTANDLTKILVPLQHYNRCRAEALARPCQGNENQAVLLQAAISYAFCRGIILTS